MNILRRASAHPSARACQFVLAMFALMGFAELLCRLRGVGEIS
jgi:hypothetical protein